MLLRERRDEVGMADERIEELDTLQAEARGDGAGALRARRRCERVGSMIEAASVRCSGVEHRTPIRCRRRPGGRACPGWMVVRRIDLPPQIHWRCSSCKDAGVVRGFRRSAFDLSRMPETVDPESRRVDLLLAAGDYAELEAASCDAATRRLILRGEPVVAGVHLEASLAELEVLREWVCAELAAASGRTRIGRLRRIWRRLDEVLDPPEVGDPAFAPLALPFLPPAPQAASEAERLAWLHARATPPPRANAAARRALLELRIELSDLRPAVWRRFTVPGDLTLDELHGVLQAVMGWSDFHLHEFVTAGLRIGDLETVEFEEDLPLVDERVVRVGDLLSARGDRLNYLYDFGDDWCHEIRVEKVHAGRSKSARDRRPRCLDGGRACPPEDCGGVHGYRELLRALRNPHHPEHESLREWVGADFAPELFSVEEVNDRLS